MNDALTGKTSKSEPGTDWDKLQRLTPADIRAAINDDPDAHPTDAAFWQTAKIVMPCPKSTIAIRLDKDGNRLAPTPSLSPLPLEEN